MPTYLCHGFRWHRRSIRFFVIIYDLLDAAPDWIVGRGSSSAILGHFYERYDFLPRPPSSGKAPKTHTALPQGLTDKRNGAKVEDSDGLSTKLDDDLVLINDEWSAVKLLEEYDPRETQEPSRPYAYVADYAVRVELSAGVTEEIARYETIAKEGGNSAWFGKLRDALEKDEEIGWFVVVNGNDEDVVQREESEREAKAAAPIPTKPHANDSIPEEVQNKTSTTDRSNGADLGKFKDARRPLSKMRRLKDIVFRKGV